MADAVQTRIPRDRAPDSTLALLSQGYGFISGRCRRNQSDAFETRLMLRPVVCAYGADAARMFYHPGRFTRRGAMPETTLRLLQDRGSVQQLDGEAHHTRKRLFMTLAAQPAARERLLAISAATWRRRIAAWAGSDRVTLLPEVESILCRAACEWAGVPLPEVDAERRTHEFSAGIEAAGGIGPSTWRALWLRRRTERWLRSVVEDARAGRSDASKDTALALVAAHRDPGGAPLTLEEAAVELHNVLRPTVAVARFVTFAALALHEHPGCREDLRDGGAALTRFVHEVRRFYPFFPAIGGRVREPFDWHGRRFREGDWVLLDLYGTNHDPRSWSDPGRFRPERFLDWDGSGFDFVPQGGGEYETDHRCPGERITIDLLKQAVSVLVNETEYEVPPQDLSVDLTRLPAKPTSGFVLRPAA